MDENGRDDQAADGQEEQSAGRDGQAARGTAGETSETSPPAMKGMKRDHAGRGRDPDVRKFWLTGGAAGILGALIAGAFAIITPLVGSSDNEPEAPGHSASPTPSASSPGPAQAGPTADPSPTGKPSPTGCTDAATAGTQPRIIACQGPSTTYGSKCIENCAFIEFRAIGLRPNTEYRFFPYASRWKVFNQGAGLRTNADGGLAAIQFPFNGIGQRVRIIAEGPDGERVVSNTFTWAAR